MSNLPFPERVLHQHIATLGKTGAGQTDDRQSGESAPGQVKAADWLYL